MKYLNRKIKGAIIISIVCLFAFIGFSKAGILFATKDISVVTVSTTKKTFDPKMYVASLANIKKMNEENTTTLISSDDSKTTKKTSLKSNQTKTTTTTITTTTAFVWTGSKLTKSKGVVEGPSGKETYYNLNMNVIVNIMRNLGFSEAEYPYWIREDGVKMLGNYVMVAANYAIRPRGTILESSLGKAIVCDTGSFVNSNPTQLDIAVNWR